MFNCLIDIRIWIIYQLIISMNENMYNSHYCYEQKIIVLQQSPTDVELMRHMETLVGKTRGKGVKVQHMVNVEKANQELDMRLCAIQNTMKL